MKWQYNAIIYYRHVSPKLHFPTALLDKNFSSPVGLDNERGVTGVDLDDIVDLVGSTCFCRVDKILRGNYSCWLVFHTQDVGSWDVTPGSIGSSAPESPKALRM